VDKTINRRACRQDAGRRERFTFF